MVNIEFLQKTAYDINKKNGWYEKEAKPLEVHALIISEISEATEFVRNEKNYLNKRAYWEELGDAVIRIFSYAQSKEVDMEDIITSKLVKNLNRGYKHGDKTI
jgi:NTP pyrophosphatase (non-canonical NTP hydrolase)